MAQRIALVMSIVREAKLLIVDEPTSALDFDNRNQLMKLLNHVVQEHNMTLLFITHDLSLAMDYATHISVMRNGQMIESGEANDILVRPEHAYSQQLIELAHRRYRYVAD
ncbi:ABC transporter ATP-binding protein [Mycobacteroides abscessus subsp. abscessus]|nr:ABC transporter ATP-binding protein [Mycobacteroides abscessus subsp. abscessus]